MTSLKHAFKCMLLLFSLFRRFLLPITSRQSELQERLYLYDACVYICMCMNIHVELCHIHMCNSSKQCFSVQDATVRATTD